MLQVYDKKYALQGTAGSYSYEALMHYHGEELTDAYKCFDTFDEVFEAVISGKVELGILPIENSSTGSINAVYDLLQQHEVRIVGEVYLRITHHLMSAFPSDISEIETVYSHIQGYEQSKNFFKKHTNLHFIPYKNTALSAEKVAKQQCKTEAAIASRLAAEIHKLHIIEENINDQNNNFTRFIMISMKDIPSEQANKISIRAVVDHIPGSLFRMLSCFDDEKINLVKIESRPLKGRPWEYSFYIDFEGSLNEERIKRALAHIKTHAREFKLLGNYRSGEVK